MNKLGKNDIFFATISGDNVDENLAKKPHPLVKVSGSRHIYVQGSSQINRRAAIKKILVEPNDTNKLRKRTAFYLNVGYEPNMVAEVFRIGRIEAELGYDEIKKVDIFPNFRR